jgi:pre-mRNA cleavage complex 2 protein Pcf11
MYQQYQQQQQQQPQPHHQAHGGQPNGSAQNQEAVDPIVARQLYRNELATLTFNSKPIITSLTIAAGDNVSVSKVIVQTIEERLRTVSTFLSLS